MYNNVNFENDDNKWTLYHLNCRGFQSKKKSLDAIMGHVKANIITLNETCLRKRQKTNIVNYKSFNRNRCTGQIMGGVSTSVANDEKDFAILTKEGLDRDEFIVTRHCNFDTPINIVNVYGEQEQRETRIEVENRWMRIMEELIKIERRHEACILVGDLNKHIGNDDLGVRNSHPKITFGGELVRALLSEGKYVCLNNHPSAVGGPFTRYDPSCPGDKNKMSCIDLVIISKNLLPFFKSIEIDCKQKFSPSRPISKITAKYPDHFPIIVTFRNLSKNKLGKPSKNVHTIWNTHKEGGWEAFKMLSDNQDLFTNIISKENENTTADVANLQKKMTKIKFSAFGKVKLKPPNVDKKLKELMEQKHVENTDENLRDINQRILEIQRVDFEREIEEVLMMKKSKGKSASIFNTLKKILGNKKAEQEQIMMMDPISKEPLLDQHSIKQASLQYVVDLLNNKSKDENYTDFYYIQDMIHIIRSEDNNEEELLTEAFDNRLKIVQMKAKDKYKFLINSGEAFKKCVYKLFEKIWDQERKPQQWRDTIIVQLFKGKGESSDYNNQRNIHTKEDLPKLFEGIVVDKSKAKLVKKCSKFQIGGIPGHRPQEHLFTAKSVISLYNHLDIPLFLQLWDISKYFDKEILRDAMDTLHGAGITGKLYRLWFMINKDTQVRVKTSFGMTQTAATGENVAQGSIGGGIISSLNLDKTITAHFGGSDTDLSYGPSRLSPLLFQDDAAKFSTGLAEAQKGNVLISQAMKMKQLELNIDKSATIIFGKRKKVDQIRNFIEQNNSLTINGINVKIKDEEKYLGDYFHSGGLSKSVEVTVNKRYGAVLNSIIELKAVIEDFRMHKLGGIISGLDIFKMALLPSLLNNSSTWLDTPKKTIDKLENLQTILMRCLLAVPNSTPITALNWDLGMMGMEHRINEHKLMFLHYLLSSEDSMLAKEVFNIQKNLDFPGFVPEARSLIQKYSLPDILDSNVVMTKDKWANLMKKAIKEQYESELKKQMETSSKLKESKLVKEEFKVQDYIKEMNIVDARTNFRIRCSIMNTIKMNQKNNPDYARTLWLCEECGKVDSQSHIMWCPSLTTLREGLNIDSDLDVVHYFQRVVKLRESLKNQD